MDVSAFRILVILSCGLNIFAFALFTVDKLGAKMKVRRSAEHLLLLAAAFGPAGALAAMVVFRHKIRHVKFFLVPLFFILHALFFIVLWFQLTG